MKTAITWATLGALCLPLSASAQPKQIDFCQAQCVVADPRAKTLTILEPAEGSGNDLREAWHDLQQDCRNKRNVAGFSSDSPSYLVRKLTLWRQEGSSRWIQERASGWNSSYHWESRRDSVLRLSAVTELRMDFAAAELPTCKKITIDDEKPPKYVGPEQPMG
jgi:hypothetical protein